PNRTNVVFLFNNPTSGSASKIRVRFWERGTGETKACGSGACAAAAASWWAARDRNDNAPIDSVVIGTPGGDLSVRPVLRDDHPEGLTDSQIWLPHGLWLTGPAVLERDWI